jgi:glycosyltransferase involved in cell wall biosynthesis
MKIFLLASSFPDEKNKASGIFNYRMVKQMKEIGQEVTVVFFRMLLPGRKLITSYYFDDIKVIQVCLPLFPIDSYFFLRINNGILRYVGWKLLRTHLVNSDIIHSVYLTNNGIVAGHWSKKLKIPHIAQAIGSDVNSDMPRMVRSTSFNKWMNNIDGIIANSNNLQQKIKHLYSNCPETKTIYRGIYIDQRETFDEPKQLKNQVSFLFLGGLNPYKRLKYGINTKGGITLMEAWKLVEKELNELNATLYFGGPFSDSNILKKWRSTLIYSGRIHMIGEIDPLLVKDFFNKSDMIIIPSMEEGLPNLLLESYASGRAVIGSTAGGIPEVIINNETGYIFNIGEEKELARLLVKAASDNKENAKMGAKAYERAKVYFNANEYSERVLNFYNKIIHDLAE